MAITRKSFATTTAGKIIVSGLKSMIVKENILIVIRIPNERHLS